MDFELSISTIMLLLFILFVSVGIWKVWAFLPNKRLSDDDTTREAKEELEGLMLKIIVQNKGLIDEKELFSQMNKDEDFNSQLFWRFNLNKLLHLLSDYYMKNSDTSTIMDIYQTQKDKK